MAGDSPLVPLPGAVEGDSLTQQAEATIDEYLVEQEMVKLRQAQKAQKTQERQRKRTVTDINGSVPAPPATRTALTV